MNLSNILFVGDSCTLLYDIFIVRDNAMLEKLGKYYWIRWVVQKIVKGKSKRLPASTG